MMHVVMLVSRSKRRRRRISETLTKQKWGNDVSTKTNRRRD
jgi:hypothetical protein